MASGIASLRVLHRRSAASVKSSVDAGFIAPRMAAVGWWRQMTVLGQGEDAMKEEIKHRAWPDKGTTIQEGSEEKAKAAKEAGYERAFEDAADIHKSEGMSGKLKQAGHMVSDAAKGVGEMASKVADMGKEGMGRAVETARGLTGAAPPDAQEKRVKVDEMGKAGGQRGGS